VDLRIEPGEPLPHAIRRLAQGELGEAHDAAGDRRRQLGTRVHDVRTAVKKLRALNRLVRPRLGRPARHADRRLRAIAHAVAPLRDDDVVLKTFDRVIDGVDKPMRTALAGLRARLAARLAARSRAFGEDERVRELRAQIEHERRGIGDWTPNENRWRAIDDGFKRGYRRAREAMAAAYRSESGTAFHTWRRTVKTHRHQVAALQPIAPGRLTARVSQLDRLGELLGNEHDLTVLEQAIRRERSRIPDQRQLERLLRLVVEHRALLRRRARPLGLRLFAEAPSVFRDRAKRDFRRFRQRSR